MCIVIFKKYSSRARTEFYMGIVPFDYIDILEIFINNMGVVFVVDEKLLYPLERETISKRHNYKHRKTLSYFLFNSLRLFPRKYFYSKINIYNAELARRATASRCVTTRVRSASGKPYGALSATSDLSVR